MTPQQLTDGCAELRGKVHSTRTIARRLLNVRANARTPFRILLYLVSNLISRQDIRQKQGMEVGA